MLMIAAALYCEAKPLIQYFHLKKDNEINKFQVFRSEDILLIITNTGSIHASVALTYLCTLFPPASSDLFVNIGICGAVSGKRNQPPGKAFLCNKITEKVTGRNFYPDILYAHPFDESSIITCPLIVHASETSSLEALNEKLYDMEAAGIFQAAAYFFEPHRMFFIKIISDYGLSTSEFIEVQHSELHHTEKVTELIEENMAKITDWLKNMCLAVSPEKPVFTSGEEEYIRNLARSLHCSVTMEYKLKQMLLYYKLVHGSFLKLTDEFIVRNKIPCNTKTEGKIYFEQLREQLI